MPLIPRKGSLFVPCLIALTLAFGHTALGGETPSTASAGQTAIQKKKNPGNPGAWLAAFFRDHLSAVDGDRCPSLPTCSSYSVQAFKKHGFLMGWLMTVDRLIHEADEPAVSPTVLQGGKFKTLDPVENNDFWWFHEKKMETD